MSTETTCEVITSGHKPIYRAHLSEQWRVWWQNWKVRHVKKAIRVLSKELQKDPGFRQTWHANIAMPIYDATRWQCYCALAGSPTPNGGHLPNCVAYKAHNFNCQNMNIEQANYIAERLMKHLFDV